jgi:type IV pilus assembly protein PilW
MPNTNATLARQSGFTLIEIMVGLAIGLLATLVILQVISVFETQKRTTTGTADAQTNGSIALYNLTRELQQAGYPLMPGISAADPSILESPFECTTVTFGGTGMTGITPVSIVDGTSDTIIIRYGNSQSGGIPTKVDGIPTASAVPVASSLGCDDSGDIALFVNSTTCATAVIPVSGVIDASTIALSEALPAAAVEGANFSCLGDWIEATYAVNNANLERNGTPTVAGIVNIQAQYGVSASPNSNQVTQWVEPSSLTLTNITERNRIKAIRISVVARNEKTEGSDVTTAVSAWTGSASSPAPAIDLSADADWQRYRYRVFETIVPLRNMIWAKDAL